MCDVCCVIIEFVVAYLLAYRRQCHVHTVEVENTSSRGRRLHNIDTYGTTYSPTIKLPKEHYLPPSTHESLTEDVHTLFMFIL